MKPMTQFEHWWFNNLMNVWQIAKDYEWSHEAVICADGRAAFTEKEE